MVDLLRLEGKDCIIRRIPLIFTKMPIFYPNLLECHHLDRDSSWQLSFLIMIFLNWKKGIPRLLLSGIFS